MGLHTDVNLPWRCLFISGIIDVLLVIRMLCVETFIALLNNPGILL